MRGGSGGGGGLSKLSTALIVVLVISLVALFAQLLYAWWRRRVFRRQINIDQLNIYNSSSDSSFSYNELLYFFCIRSHSRIESKSVTATSTISDRNSNRRSDIELLKLQGIFAPPRFLFTIKEEDREDLELPGRPMNRRWQWRLMLTADVIRCRSRRPVRRLYTSLPWLPQSTR